jgi:UDP-2-acetamido-3-amino-2,3-dideoxy-glucuronate N-acetyltransferase
MENVRIHQTAEVSSNCEIGEGTVVWNQVQIREKSKIGANCILSKDVYIDTEAVIGNRVKIQNGVSVYKGVTVEDDVFLGPHMVFTNDFYPRAFSKDWEVRPTRVKKGASIGANATVVCGNTIGEYAMVAAGSVVTHDVPAYGLVMGNPARLCGFVCKCGHKLESGIHTSSYICKSCGERVDLGR